MHSISTMEPRFNYRWPDPRSVARKAARIIGPQPEHHGSDAFTELSGPTAVLHCGESRAGIILLPQFDPLMPGSSMAEQAAVNRKVVGSSPTRAAIVL